MTLRAWECSDPKCGAQWLGDEWCWCCGHLGEPLGAATIGPDEDPDFLRGHIL